MLAFDIYYIRHNNILLALVTNIKLKYNIFLEEVALVHYGSLMKQTSELVDLNNLNNYELFIY